MISEAKEFHDCSDVQELYRSSCCCVELRCAGQGGDHRLSPRERVQRNAACKDFARGLALPASSVTNVIDVGVSDQLDTTIQVPHGHPHKSIGSALQVTSQSLLEHRETPFRRTSHDMTQHGHFILTVTTVMCVAQQLLQSRGVQRRFKRFQFKRCLQESFASTPFKCWCVVCVSELQSVQNIMRVFSVWTELNARFKFRSQPFQIIIRLATLEVDFTTQECESRMLDASPQP